MRIKLGPHFIRPVPSARQWALSASVVKTLEDTSVFKGLSDSTIRIFRHAVKDEMDTTSPEDTVLNILNALRGYNHPALVLQLWCGAHPTRVQLTRAVKLCHSKGYKTLGSSWFTGDYTRIDWDDATAAGVDYYGPQCYFGNKGLTLFHALRYRAYWRSGDAPVLIPECGRDEVEGGGPGWKVSGVTAEEYGGNELSYFNAALNQDPFVIGGTVFASGPREDFENFSTDGIEPFILNGMLKQQEAISMINVGEGLLKADPLIGPIVMNEVIDGHVRRISTEKGWATYDDRTNETIVYAIDGRIWRDLGNHSKNDGKLVSVTGPF